MNARYSGLILGERISPRTGMLVGLISAGALAFGTLEGWALWEIGLVGLLPWIPLFVQQLTWVYRHYEWLALFYALVVTQAGHFVEHVAQMIQIHLLGLQGAAARGIFGSLDIEWVHFVWNTWVLIAVLVLLRPYGRSGWLRLTLLLTGWHELEHAYIFSVYLQTGISGTPGLLSSGGLIGGGLPLSRPDLHFLYNLAETVPLLLGFVLQLQVAERPMVKARRGTTWNLDETAPG
jgi:hypothetical protein